MLKSALALSALVLSAAAGAASPPPPQPVVDPVVVLTAQPTAGATKGQLRVEWVGPRDLPKDELDTGELRVYRVGHATPLQVIPVETGLTRAELALHFTDLNGDGYADLVFETWPMGSGFPAHDADAFLWIPKLQRFVKSETLSQLGEYSPGRRPNCVIAGTKCSSTNWWVKEFCFNQTTGRWRKVADNNCTNPE